MIYPCFAIWMFIFRPAAEHIVVVMVATIAATEAATAAADVPPGPTVGGIDRSEVAVIFVQRGWFS